MSVLQDVNTTRYHVLLSERLLKTELQAAGYKKTMLGFSYRLAIFPRDGKVPSRWAPHPHCIHGTPFSPLANQSTW